MAKKVEFRSTISSLLSLLVMGYLLPRRGKRFLLRKLAPFALTGIVWLVNRWRGSRSAQAL